MSALEYSIHTGPPSPAQHSAIEGLYAECFGEAPPVDFAERLAQRQGLMLVLANRGDEVVGYKLGYARNCEVFYSWLGGVSAGHRRAGIATQLASLQHRWCKAQGYHAIRSDTTNQFRTMLLLNLRQGFDVIGSYQDDTRNALIVMLKKTLKDE